MSFPNQPGGEPGRYPGWDHAPSGQPGPGWQAAPQADPRMAAPYGYQPPPTQKRGPWAWLIPLLIVLFVAILVAAAWGMGLFGERSGETGAGGVVTVTATEEAPAAEAQAVGEPAAADRPSPDPVADAQRPTSPSLPAGAVAANQAARTGAPAGDFNNVYRGTDVTSEPFALAVRNDFVGSYLANGSLTQTIYTYSPVTGQRYEMNCSDNGSYVTCRGGNNAVVYIS